MWGHSESLVAYETDMMITRTIRYATRSSDLGLFFGNGFYDAKKDLRSRLQATKHGATAILLPSKMRSSISALPRRFETTKTILSVIYFSRSSQIFPERFFSKYFRISAYSSASANRHAIKLALIAMTRRTLHEEATAKSFYGFVSPLTSIQQT